MRKFILNFLLVAILVFIWGNSMVPGESSGELSGKVLDTMNAAAAGVGLPDDFFTYYQDTDGDGIPEPTAYIVRKMAHMTEFAALAMVLWLRLESRGRKRTLTAFLGSACVAAVDELIQRFAVNRGSSFIDVMIDCSGAALGLLVINALTWLFHRVRAKK